MSNLKHRDRRRVTSLFIGAFAIILALAFQNCAVPPADSNQLSPADGKAIDSASSQELDQAQCIQEGTCVRNSAYSNTNSLSATGGPFTAVNPLDCVFAGTIVRNNTSVQAFRTNYQTTSQCYAPTNIQQRKCVRGVLSGSYTLRVCPAPIVTTTTVSTVTTTVPTDPTDPTVPTSQARVCEARTAAGIRVCIDDILTNRMDHLKITENINCSFQNECYFKFHYWPNRPTNSAPIKIYGANSSITITRTGMTKEAFNYPVFQIIDYQGSQIELSSLKLNDSPQVEPVFYTQARNELAGVGEGTIDLKSSRNILIQNLEVNGSIFAGIANRATQNVTVNNSKFLNMRQYSIWIFDEAQDAQGNIALSYNFKIKNNLFKDGAANLLYSSVTGEISNNTFTNNHRKTVFNALNCAYDGHSGGQLLIEKQTTKVAIFCNDISNGYIPAAAGIDECLPLRTDIMGRDDQISSGIEFASNSISNVLVARNRLRNNDGYAAYLNHGPAANLPNIWYYRNYQSPRVGNNLPLTSSGGGNSFVTSSQYPNCDPSTGTSCTSGPLPNVLPFYPNIPNCTTFGAPSFPPN